MGRRGPPREPTALKLLKGTARRKDRERNEPHPRGNVMLPKKLMTREALRIAKILRPVLTGCRLLTPADSVTYALTCSHAAVALMAVRQIEQTSLLIKDRDGEPRKNPLLQILRDNSESFRNYARLFGLSPAARSEIDLPGLPRDRRELLLSNDEDAERFFDNRWADLARKS